MLSHDLTVGAASPELDRLARRRASAKLGWYLHAAVYIVVNLVLMVVSAHSASHWAVFPAWGWGLGLALHGAGVYLSAGHTAVFERMVQTERNRMAHHANRQP